MNEPAKLNLDLVLEEVARKVRPVASVYTINPSNCETSACNPQCECCSGPAPASCIPGAQTCRFGCYEYCPYKGRLPLPAPGESPAPAFLSGLPHREDHLGP